jgi:hypothetical protein
MANIRPAHTASGRAVVEPLEGPLRPLCPSCRTTVVRVSVAASVLFDVVAAGGDDAHDLQVIGHEWHDASWDGDTAAVCGSCGWRGRVADLRAPTGA